MIRFITNFTIFLLGYILIVLGYQWYNKPLIEYEVLRYKNDEGVYETHAIDKNIMRETYNKCRKIHYVEYPKEVNQKEWRKCIYNGND